jgi:peptidoglycan/LPS O-acetylase OafA/YrhL
LQRIECLDGLRGLAALWVLVGHCMLLTGFYLPVMGQPDFGVDLFILLSGFLMVFQYQLRQNFEDWGRLGTWASFWTRRFFRIAPLFYLMLAAGLLAGPIIYEDRVVIDIFLGRELQQPARYLDAGATNIALHATFLFGLLPSYAFRTPLPDWSLGLEMQFYAVFPFLILLMRKSSWPVTALLVSSMAATVVWAMTRTGISYPMPAFLPLKMHLFLCGMLTAAALGGSRKRLALYLGLVIMLAAIPIGGTQDLQHMIVRTLIVLVFFALVHARVVGTISALLGSRPLYWLGELSYGVYLLHLLIMQPVAAWAITRWGHGMDAPERFLLVLGIVAPLTYAIAYVTYTIVEVPGQKMGKSLLRAFTANRRNASQTPAEEIAVP